MFEELFAGKKMNPARLFQFGFREENGHYIYLCPILQNVFLLQIDFDSLGRPSTFLFDCNSGEEYFLYKTSAQGSYVGSVREAVSAVLEDVIRACFEEALYREEQTYKLLSYAREAFGDLPEYLWEKSPQNAILRRKDSGKWYAALLVLPRKKLGLSSDQMAEIVNVHASPKTVEQLLQREHFYPAFHMNKRSWITLILDGTVQTGEVLCLLRESYRLASKKPLCP